MYNLEKLKELGILGDIRQRLGAKDEDDDSFDVVINVKSANDLLSEWSGWELGDVYWWQVMKRYYDFLSK